MKSLLLALIAAGTLMIAVPQQAEAHPYWRARGPYYRSYYRPYAYRAYRPYYYSAYRPYYYGSYYRPYYRPYYYRPYAYRNWGPSYYYGPGVSIGVY